MGRPNYPLKMVGARLLVCLAFPVIAAALPAMLAGEEGSVQPKPEAMNSTAPAPDTKQFVDPKDVPKEWVPEMPKDMPKDWPKDIPYTAEAWAKLTPAEFAKYIPGYEEKKKNATQAETDKEAQTSSMDKKLNQFWDPMSGNFIGPDGKKYDPSSLKPWAAPRAAMPPRLLLRCPCSLTLQAATTWALTARNTTRAPSSPWALRRRTSLEP